LIEKKGWIGHDEYKKMPGQQGSNAAILWQRYMKAILEGKEDRPILEGDASDYGVTRYTVCGVSGLKCTDACSADTFHPPVTDYFAVGDAPSEVCNMHSSSAKICTEGNCAPGPYCPEESIQSVSGVVIPEGSPYAQLDKDSLSSIFPNLVTGASSDDSPDAVPTGECPVHTEQWALEQSGMPTAISEANSAIEEAELYLYTEGRLSQAQKNRLISLITAVRNALNASEDTKSVAAIQSATSNLLAAKREIQASLAEPSPSPSPPPSPSPSISPSPEPSPSPSP
ncbi:MAG: hypothetical protein KH334_08340, partial [Clostridiales bacterium]|nr:hypothetical protein [Clostridiales bacterium]